MRCFSNQRFLVAYSALVTVAFSVTVLCGFVMQPKRATFDQIDVHRLNVVEPDGKLRLVISNRSELPGVFVQGKEIRQGDRGAAGMLFLDDEGTEMGGLIYGGSKDKDGKVHNNGHLSFDQYMQDQIFSIDAGENAGSRYSAITISDRGDYPITEMLESAQRIRGLPEEQRAAEWEKFASTHPQGRNRIIFGRYDGTVLLRMKDTKERDRLVIQVQADGTPLIKFLDQDGKVISQLPK